MTVQDGDEGTASTGPTTDGRYGSGSVSAAGGQPGIVAHYLDLDNEVERETRECGRGDAGCDEENGLPQHGAGPGRSPGTDLGKDDGDHGPQITSGRV